MKEEIGLALKDGESVVQKFFNEDRFAFCVRFSTRYGSDLMDMAWLFDSEIPADEELDTLFQDSINTAEKKLTQRIFGCQPCI